MATTVTTWPTTRRRATPPGPIRGPTSGGRRPRSARRSPRPPPAGGVPAPPHRRAVGDDDADRDVDDDRPLELRRGARARTRLAIERPAQHDDGADGDHDREPTVRWRRRRRDGTVWRGPHPTVEVAQHRLARRVGVPAGRRRRWRRTPSRAAARCPAVDHGGSVPVGRRRRPAGATMAPVQSLWAATMPVDRLVPGEAAQTATSTSTWRSSAPASRACGPRCRSPQRDPALRHRGARAPQRRVRRQRPQRRVVLGVADDEPDRVRRRARARRGHRRAAGDARDRRRGRALRRRRDRRRRVPQGRHRHVRPHAGPARPAGRPRSTRRGRSASATTTCGG